MEFILQSTEGESQHTLIFLMCDNLQNLELVLWNLIYALLVLSRNFKVSAFSSLDVFLFIEFSLRNLFMILLTVLLLVVVGSQLTRL